MKSFSIRYIKFFLCLIAIGSNSVDAQSLLPSVNASSVNSGAETAVTESVQTPETIRDRVSRLSNQEVREGSGRRRSNGRNPLDHDA